jgi:hypothetical protein
VTATVARNRNRSGEIGTKTAESVVKVLQRNGFPYAERRSLKGAKDQGDITGTPGVCWEVKGGNAARNASDLLVTAWLAETERERVNAGADVGVLVVARKGIGDANADHWWAILRLIAVVDLTIGNDDFVQPDTWSYMDAAPVRMHLADALLLLRGANYGEPVAS